MGSCDADDGQSDLFTITRVGHQPDRLQPWADRFTRQGAMRYTFSIEWKRVFQLNGISHFN